MNRRELLRELSRVQATWVNRNAAGTGDLDITAEQEADYLGRVSEVFERAREQVRRRNRQGRGVTAANIIRSLIAAHAPDWSDFRFDPTQRRDPHGRWSVFGGIPLLAQELHLGDGSVRLEARGDGLHIDLTDSGGRANKSNGLDMEATAKLSSLLELAADPDEQPDRRVTKPVHTFGSDTPDDPATGYAQVTYGAGEPIELELLDSDASIKLEPAEARVLAQDLGRVGAARRIEVESGPLDMFLPGGHQVGVRTTGADGQPVEVRFDGDEWRELWHGADVLWEGFDETGEMFDPEQDVDHLTINTTSGPLKMRRIGEADSKESRLQLESPGKFTIEFRTNIKDPIWHAKDPVTEYGQAQG